MKGQGRGERRPTKKASNPAKGVGRQLPIVTRDARSESRNFRTLARWWAGDQWRIDRNTPGKIERRRVLVFLICSSRLVAALLPIDAVHKIQLPNEKAIKPWQKQNRLLLLWRHLQAREKLNRTNTVRLVSGSLSKNWTVASWQLPSRALEVILLLVNHNRVKVSVRFGYWSIRHGSQGNRKASSILWRTLSVPIGWTLAAE